MITWHPAKQNHIYVFQHVTISILNKEHCQMRAKSTPHSACCSLSYTHMPLHSLCSASAWVRCNTPTADSLSDTVKVGCISILVHTKLPHSLTFSPRRYTSLYYLHVVWVKVKHLSLNEMVNTLCIVYSNIWCDSCDALDYMTEVN